MTEYRGMKAIIIASLILAACCTEEPDHEIDPPLLAPNALEILHSTYYPEIGHVVEIGILWPLEDVEDHLCQGGTIEVTHPGEIPFRLTLMAHSVAHCYVGDPHHQLDGWWGEDGLVEIANLSLLNAGY